MNSPGKLYIVSTPIGNLEDISYRTARILGEVDFIAAEDTRVTAKILNHLGLKKSLISCQKYNEKERSEQIVSRMLAYEGLVNGKKLLTGNLTAEDWRRIGDAATTISNTRISLLSSGQRLKSTVAKPVVVITEATLKNAWWNASNRLENIPAIFRAMTSVLAITMPR